MQPLPGAADTLSLAGYGLASRWQALLRFWLSVLVTAAALVLVLEILGPPERSDDAGPLPEAAQALKLAPAALPAQPAGRLVDPERLPAASAPMRPEPNQPAPPAIPSPVAAAPADAPRPRVILVLHPARPDGGTIAGRLATQSGLAPDQIDIGPVAEARSEAVIRFYSTGDHALARRLGKELTRMNCPWRIENFAARSWAWKDQAVEVFLPDR